MSRRGWHGAFLKDPPGLRALPLLSLYPGGLRSLFTPSRRRTPRWALSAVNIFAQAPGVFFYLLSICLASTFTQYLRSWTRSLILQM